MTAIEFNQMVIGVRDQLFYFSSRFYKSEDDRLDLVQETIVKALHYRDKFYPGTNFRAWVFTIMKNTFINEYKKNQKRQLLTSSTDVYDNERNFVDKETPHHIYQKNEFHSQVHNLNEKYRDPLKMYHEGYKYDEIAEKLDLPIGTVKNRIHTARHLLINSYN